MRLKSFSLIKIPRYLATSVVLIATLSRLSSREDGLREGDTFNATVLLRCRAKLFDNIHLEILFNSDSAKLSNLSVTTRQLTEQCRQQKV